MKDLLSNASSRTTVIALAIIALFVLIIPISVIGVGGVIVFGTAVGVGSALQEAPATCKVPPNIFDTWDTLRSFVSGVDCNSNCGAGDATAGVSGTAADYVKTIIGTGNAMGVPEKGQIVAIATALVESNLKNYANDGIYDTSRNPSDATLSNASAILGFIKKSLSYPHDAVGSDASSVGLFQQQAWWGTIGNSSWQTDPDNTIKRLMDPVFQSQKFYDRMLTIPNWQQMDYGVIAQTVQVSANPGAYSKRVSEAQSLYSQYKGQATSVKLYDLGKTYTVTPGDGSSSGCTGTPGLVLDKSSLYAVTSIWAEPPQDYRQGRYHGGVDFGCHQYENVYAPIDGVVILAVTGNQSGMGYPMGDIQIRTADGSTLEFMHTRNTFVKPGQQVSAGTVLGECASTGNSTGSHLHVQIDVTNSTNAALKALPTSPNLSAGLRDPVLALDILGVDICPPYSANRKTSAVSSPLPSSFFQCWPPAEWVK